MSGWGPDTEVGPSLQGAQRTAATRNTRSRIQGRNGLLGRLAPRRPYIQVPQKDRQESPTPKVVPHLVHRRHSQPPTEDEENVQSLDNSENAQSLDNSENAQSLNNRPTPPPSNSQGLWARRFESILAPKGPSNPATPGMSKLLPSLEESH